jgi:hypothetical protein
LLAEREQELAALRRQMAALLDEHQLEVEALSDERDGLDAALEVVPRPAQYCILMHENVLLHAPEVRVGGLLAAHLGTCCASGSLRLRAGPFQSPVAH